MDNKPEQESKEPETPFNIVPLSEALRFAEWISLNRWEFSDDKQDGFWWYDGNERECTKSLWGQFKEEKNK